MKRFPSFEDELNASYWCGLIFTRPDHAGRLQFPFVGSIAGRDIATARSNNPFKETADVIANWGLALPNPKFARGNVACPYKWPVVTPDDGYVAASLLYRERFDGLTALKRWIEKLPEGKVRSRKPNAQRLEIHNADWTRYWAEEDRLKSEALDDESLQETIADIEAGKLGERKKKRKR